MRLKSTELGGGGVEHRAGGWGCKCTGVGV